MKENKSKAQRIIGLLLLLLLPVNFILSQQISSVKHPEWSCDKTIYEVNIRQFTPQGTFKAFEEHLPRLKEMGIGILWLMPIHPIGELNRKGSLGSYYSVKDYKGINTEFGTLDDFKRLVKKIHELGMYVIIDWVANHSSWDNEWTKTNPEFYATDSTGKFVPPVPDWADVIKLNYDNKKLWPVMIDAMKYWVEECDIDGYRCDVAGMVPTEFWNQARKELAEIKPLFMLAEWESPQLHEHAFDMTYGWELLHIMNEIAQEKKNAKALAQYFEKEKQIYPSDAYRMYFTSNHDENTWNGTEFERLDQGAETFAVFTFLAKGMPLIYSGQETGLNKRLRFFDKDTIDWKENGFSDLYTKLVHLKLENSVLWNGDKGSAMTRLENSAEQRVFSFAREKNGSKIIAVFNFTNIAVQVNIDNSLLPGEYVDFKNNSGVTLNSSEEFKLKPWEYKVFIQK